MRDTMSGLAGLVGVAAVTLAGSAFAGFCPGEGSCCEENGSPGCEDADCCELVCAIEPICCTAAWDAACVALAGDNCGKVPGAPGGSYCPEFECGAPDAGNCCLPNGTPACADSECCTLVCDEDSFCCDVEWDATCALDADELCGCTPPFECPPSDHNCFTAGGPGCTDLDCCEVVCTFDPFCCDVSWDSKCVGEAAVLCDGCGDLSAGDCCAANGTAYCDDRECCDVVCDADPFCCDTEWDATCADGAAELCSICGPICGSPLAGDCCVANGTPGCFEFECCEAVCAVDPFCCDDAWDGICAGLAADLCESCAETSDCCSANGTPGCDDAECEGDVCALDSFCCAVEWDDLCAGLAAENCAACAGSEPSGLLSLEAMSCQGDALPDEPGNQILVELWMRELNINATGFTAAVAYDAGVLTFRGDLSSYTDSPFAAHDTAIGDAVVFPGQLALDGSTDDAGTSDDSLLAILYFDVEDDCATTALGFAGDKKETDGGPVSTLSAYDTPFATTLAGTPELGLDPIGPVITCPKVVFSAADVEIAVGDGPGGIVVDPCVGAVVTFQVTASDNCESVTLECTPPSGSFFPIGETTVQCVATDTCGYETMCTFPVIVTPTNRVEATVVLVGSQPATRCVHFVADCAVVRDELLDFVVPTIASEADVVATAVFEVPCNVYESLCGKDEQHTLWDTVDLVPAGDRWLATAPMVLLPGDDDNDGDVDINDVTWLIGTFGQVALDGGCPWDGTRDADFSNGGAVGSEDFSLLAAQFLAATSCECGLPPAAALDPRRTIPTAALPFAVRGADLDGNGVFDWRDVDRFEATHGFDPVLSRRLRGAD